MKSVAHLIDIIFDHNVWSVFYLIHHLHERFPVVSSIILVFEELWHETKQHDNSYVYYKPTTI